MVKKTNILFLIDDFNFMGGTEKHLIQLVTFLDKKKFSTIICPLNMNTNTPLIQYVRQLGIKILPLPINRIYSFGAIKRVFQLIQLIRENRIEIIQTFHFSSDILGAMVAKLINIPVIISSRRDMGFAENGKHHLVARRLVNPVFTAIITVSNRLRKAIITAEHVNARKLITIYNGVNFVAYKKSINKKIKLKELGLNPGCFHVGVVANLRPIKGIEYFIEAAAQILKKIPQTQFIIVGGNAYTDEVAKPYRNKLNCLIDELKLNNNIFFLGERQDIPEILNILDVFVLSSLSEGFSNTIIEAMAAGTPVVVTDVGGNAEAVIHNKTGVIVPPKNSQAIARAVISLLSNPNRALRIGQAGKRRARELFSDTTMVANMETLYLTLLNRT